MTITAPIIWCFVYASVVNKAPNDWRCNSQLCPGGSMEQLGIHLIDALNYIFGNPISRHGFIRRFGDSANYTDWANVLLHYQDRVWANVVSRYSPTTSFHVNLSITFQHGQLFCSGVPGEFKLFSKTNGRIKAYRIRGKRGSIAQFDEFANCILGHAVPETGYRGASEAVATLTQMIDLNLTMPDSIEIPSPV